MFAEHLKQVYEVRKAMKTSKEASTVIVSINI